MQGLVVLAMLCEKGRQQPERSKDMTIGLA